VQLMIRDQYIHTGKEKEHNEKTCGGTKADNGKQDMGQQRKDFGDPQKKLITKCRLLGKRVITATELQ